MLDVFSELSIDRAWGINQYFRYLDNLELLSNKTLSLKELKHVVTENYAFMDNAGNWQTVSNNPEKSKSIAIMQLSGPMQIEDGWCTEGVQTFSNRLKANYANKDVKAVVVEGNTGGGESLAGQLLKSTVKDRNKPVIFLSHFLASAGVNASLTADARFAIGKQTQVGSIGSYISLNKKRLEEYKANYEEIYAKTSPDKNLSWRQYLSGNIDLLVEEATNSANMFRDEVSQYLTLNESLKESTLAGGMFYAEDAQNRGLIDGIMTFNETFDFIEQIFK